MKNQFLIYFFGIFSFFTVAQNNFTSFTEFELELSYSVSNIYVPTLEFENRNFLYRKDEFKSKAKHIEIAHMSNFKLKENKVIGLGLQYRFQENFDESNENEFRLVEEFSWSTSKSEISWNHRMTTEQRIYRYRSTFRSRYEFEMQMPMRKSNYYLIQAETLFEVGKHQKPEFEQRLSALIGLILNVSTNVEIGLQYRLSDYTQMIGHEMFVLCSLDIQL